MGRNCFIEVGRVISAVGIVWYHSLVEPLHELSYGGLSFFIVAMAFYWRPVAPVSTSLRALAYKFILLFIACFLVYGFANVAIGRPFMNVEDGWISAILTGPTYHLWFLSWAFFALFLLNLLLTSLGHTAAGVISAIILTLMIATAPYWRNWSLGVVSPVPQYLHAMIPFLAGVVFTVWRKWPIHVLVSGLISLDYALGQVPFFYSYVAGIALFLACYHLGNRWPLPRLGKLNLSAMMFVVYLIHPLFLGVFRHQGIGLNLVTVGVVVALSLISAYAWLYISKGVLAPMAIQTSSRKRE